MTYPSEPSMRQLAALLAAIDTGSLRRAGLMLDLGQPALSAQLAALERLVGAPLLERRSTGVVPTAEGRAVAEIAREAMDAAQRIVDRGRRAGGDPAGGRQRDVVFRLGVGASVGPYLLPYALSVLHGIAPGLRLIVREGSTVGLAESLRDGHHDMILTQLPVQGKGLQSRPVLEEAIFIMLSADHPLAIHDRIDSARLQGQTLLTLGPGFALTRQAERLAAETGAMISDGYEGSSMDALRMMCAVGQGIALVPAFYAASEVRPDGRVVTRPLSGRRLTRTLALVWRTTQGTPPEADLLSQALATGARIALG
jgi:LysR family transcriptional regulator, hydrogen peroxide-inducible genes activator